jgi:hypothetical protein
MRREPTIPLFLWVATALVVHALFGGGATEVVKVLEERLDIRSFAHLVSERARLGAEPMEISLAEEPEPEPEQLGPGHADADTQASEEPDPEETESSDEQREKEDEIEKDKPEEKEKEKESPAKEREQDKPAEEQQSEEEKKALQMFDPRRTAIRQQVEDENQKDNEDARFAAEHANHVDEETQARITANDGTEGRPELGGSQVGSPADPGNSDQQKFAQSEQIEGQKDRSVGEGGDDSQRVDGADSPEQRAAQAAAAAGAPPPPASPGQKAAEASQARQGNPETLSSDAGTFTMPRAQAARKAQQGRAALPGRQGPPEHLLGYGSQAVTKNGVNLNLSHSAAQAMIGADGLAQMRKRAGEKRLAQHRGSFQNVGIDKWRPALENYVAAVKPGNQTALNAARVPFATYLNQIHQRLHQIFADGFLASLEGLPPSHPLSNQEMSTHLEIALSREDGRIVRMGITKSSGVTMFDVGALESVKKAAPYGVPPGSIVSSDGNVYLHWEFHRRPIYACSTYFARPYILNLPQKPAPPRVEPPPRRDYDEKSPDERSGSNGKRVPKPTRPG